MCLFCKVTYMNINEETDMDEQYYIYENGPGVDA